MKFSYATQPYDKQREAFELSRDHEAFALFMDPGTGKTKVTFDTARWLFCQGFIDGMLVVAPKGCYHQWADEELETHWAGNGDISVHLWQAGSGQRIIQEREAFLMPPDPGCLDVVVMNIEYMSLKGGYMFARAFMEAHRTLLVVDESTTIKNHKASCTKHLLRLAPRATYRRILSGDPTPQSPTDILSQAIFLSPDVLGMNYWNAYARYTQLEERYGTGQRKYKAVVGYRRVEELRRKLEPYAFRCKLEECEDMPRRIYRRIDVPLPAEQLRDYQQLRDRAVLELEQGETVTAPMMITRIIRLRQMLCGFVHIEETNESVDYEDQVRLNTLLSTIESRPGKAIIWASFRHSAFMIQRALETRYGPETTALYMGGTKGRAEIQSRFNDPRDPLRFFIGTPPTGKWGLNLQQGTTMHYFSNCYNLEVRNQSERRIYRLGQKQRCVYYDYVTPGTVDEKILEVLRQKKNLSRLITGDAWREWI